MPNTTIVRTRFRRSSCFSSETSTFSGSFFVSSSSVGAFSMIHASSLHNTSLLWFCHLHVNHVTEEFLVIQLLCRLLSILRHHATRQLPSTHSQFHVTKSTRHSLLVLRVK